MAMRTIDARLMGPPPGTARPKPKCAMRDANTESGRVRGLPGKNPDYTVFKGIPYAAPPVGDLRWRAPQPAAPWEGVRECYNFSDIPIQFGFGNDGGSMETPAGRMSEDCLYLNVWTPAESPDEKLPVFFWIYGGAFVGGAANNNGTYDGEGFCRRDCIMVSFNYRAGPLGLMATKELTEENGGHGSGNYYFLDQIAALKWVRRNIANFGGDPEKITIAGHSSGSCSVTALSVTPVTKGDFRGNCILSSAVQRDFDGPAELFAPLAEIEARGAEYMELCGCKTLEEMRQAPVQTLMKALNESPMRIHTFCGAIDGELFPDNPTHMYYRGEHHDVAYLMGAAWDEESGQPPRGEPMTREDIRAYAKNFEEKEQEFLAFTETLTDEDIREATIGGCSYRNRQLAMNQLRRGGKPSWLYVFSRRLPNEPYGASHGADLPYLFQTYQYKAKPYTATDFELSNLMADYFANFTKHCDPNGEGLPLWPAYTNEEPMSMIFGDEPVVMERPLSKVAKYKLDYFTTTDVVHTMI